VIIILVLRDVAILSVAGEARTCSRYRGTVEEMIRGELDEVLSRPRYGWRLPKARPARRFVSGHRHGSRLRTLRGTFGKTAIAVPCARAPGVAQGRKVMGGVEFPLDTNLPTCEVGYNWISWGVACLLSIFSWLLGVLDS
jgi:hypothetical protein